MRQNSGAQSSFGVAWGRFDSRLSQQPAADIRSKICWRSWTSSTSSATASPARRKRSGWPLMRSMQIQYDVSVAVTLTSRSDIFPSRSTYIRRKTRPMGGLEALRFSIRLVCCLLVFVFTPLSRCHPPYQFSKKATVCSLMTNAIPNNAAKFMKRWPANRRATKAAGRFPTAHHRRDHPPTPRTPLTDMTKTIIPVLCCR